MKKIKTSFAIPAELARKLTEEATALGLSRSAYVTIILTLRKAALGKYSRHKTGLGPDPDRLECPSGECAIGEPGSCKARKLGKCGDLIEKDEKTRD